MLKKCYYLCKNPTLSMSSTQFQNKNERQLYFNQVRGVIEELNDGDKFCSITLRVGHENPRQVNLVLKKPEFDKIKDIHSVGEKVSVKFYIVSRKKNERWYTTATLLEICTDVKPTANPS